MDYQDIIFDDNPFDDFVSADELAKYEDASHLLKKIIKHVYVTGKVDSLENALDELCDVYGIKIPYSKPLIRGA